MILDVPYNRVANNNTEKYFENNCLGHKRMASLDFLTAMLNFAPWK